MHNICVQNSYLHCYLRWHLHFHKRSQMLVGGERENMINFNVATIQVAQNINVYFFS